jgi:hypothetical protein
LSPDCHHTEAADPRKKGSCCKCGKPYTSPDIPLPIPGEDYAVNIAAAAAGFRMQDKGDHLQPHPVVQSINDNAKARTLPGPLRMPRDLLAEAGEELLDARNYLAWSAALAYEQMEAGDHEATVRHDRAMRTLSAVIVAWKELQTEPS